MESKGIQTFLSCHRCGGATIHNQLCSEDSDYRYYDADGFYGYEPATYRVFRCNGCTQIAMYLWSAFHSPHSRFGDQIFPIVFSEKFELPEAVADAYREADRVKQRSKIAYAALSRRVLEAICQDRGISERNLSLAISALTKKYDVPPLLSEAAQLIRIFGNSGAHISEEGINALHAEMIAQFLDMLIEYLYVAPAALRKFKNHLGIDLPDADESDV